MPTLRSGTRSASKRTGFREKSKAMFKLFRTTRILPSRMTDPNILSVFQREERSSGAVANPSERQTATARPGNIASNSPAGSLKPSFKSSLVLAHRPHTHGDSGDGEGHVAEGSTQNRQSTRTSPRPERKQRTRPKSLVSSDDDKDVAKYSTHRPRGRTGPHGPFSGDDRPALRSSSRQSYTRKRSDSVVASIEDGEHVAGGSTHRTHTQTHSRPRSRASSRNDHESAAKHPKITMPEDYTVNDIYNWEKTNCVGSDETEAYIRKYMNWLKHPETTKYMTKNEYAKTELERKYIVAMGSEHKAQYGFLTKAALYESLKNTQSLKIAIDDSEAKATLAWKMLTMAKEQAHLAWTTYDLSYEGIKGSEPRTAWLSMEGLMALARAKECYLRKNDDSWVTFVREELWIADQHTPKVPRVRALTPDDQLRNYEQYVKGPFYDHEGLPNPFENQDEGVPPLPKEIADSMFT